MKGRLLHWTPFLLTLTTITVTSFVRLATQKKKILIQNNIIFVIWQPSKEHVLNANGGVYSISADEACDTSRQGTVELNRCPEMCPNSFSFSCVIPQLHEQSSPKRSSSLAWTSRTINHMVVLRVWPRPGVPNLWMRGALFVRGRVFL